MSRKSHDHSRKLWARRKVVWWAKGLGLINRGETPSNDALVLMVARHFGNDQFDRVPRKQRIVRARELVEAGGAVHQPAELKERKAMNKAISAFYQSYEWRRLRYSVLQRDGRRCGLCGSTPADGVKMHVDHIKPLRLFWDLRLEAANLQVLCELCNHGKGNWDQTDWRAPAQPETDELTSEFRAIVEG